MLAGGGEFFYYQCFDRLKTPQHQLNPGINHVRSRINTTPRSRSKRPPLRIPPTVGLKAAAFADVGTLILTNKRLVYISKGGSARSAAWTVGGVFAAQAIENNVSKAELNELSSQEGATPYPCRASHVLKPLKRWGNPTSVLTMWARPNLFILMLWLAVPIIRLGLQQSTKQKPPPNLPPRHRQPPLHPSRSSKLTFSHKQQPLREYAQDAAHPMEAQNSAPHAEHSSCKPNLKSTCPRLHHRPHKHLRVPPAETKYAISHSINAGTVIKRKDMFRDLAVNY